MKIKIKYDLLGIYLIVTIAFISGIFLFNSVKSEQEGPYPMNFSISTSIAITLSNELAQGIFYTNDTGAENGTNVQYPVDSGEIENATWDYVTVSRITFYNITNAGTTSEDICGKAASDLTCSPLTPGCGSGTILLANATWVNATTSNPSYPGENIWTNDYATANYTAKNLAKNGIIHTRYWLNVPSGIDSGTYNTTFTYCAVEAGQTCTCS